MKNDVTAIFFLCRRTELLRHSVYSFVQNNTHPIKDYIIVNDSGDSKIHEELRDSYEGATFVFHPENVGLIKSIDLGYAHIKTEYFFHCEDDWMVNKDGLIQKSLDIMTARSDIEEVWPGQLNQHPVEPKIYTANGVRYKIAKDNYLKGKNGYNNNAWHGFTTACGLKRLSDYKLIGPYTDIPWEGSIWHREQAIGERYHDKGYRTAVLLEKYAENIGYGLSEYTMKNNDGRKDK